MTDKKDYTMLQRLSVALWGMRNPAKNATAKVPTKNGGSYTYSYATLDSVLDVVKPALQEAGLALMQRWEEVPGELGCWELMTGITDGERVEWLDRRPMTILPDPQKQGAVETYTRRYAIVTAFGLAAVEDTDAQGVGDPLKAAKDELVKACTAYAKAAGRDAKEVMVEATKLACFEKTPAGYRATAQHYAKLMGEA